MFEQELIFSRKENCISNGVKIFSDTDFYWFNTYKKETINELTREISGGFDFSQACKKVGVDTRYLRVYNRSDFIYFLPYSEHSGDFRILDLGAGFGNITIPLAKRMPNASIYAVDASIDILSLLKARASIEGCENIEFCKTDIFEKQNLPFKKKSFDLIIMNGVLEWIGSAISTGNPKDIQISFLKYIKGFLKDDGFLFIGIEGRFFPGYFKNIPDPHSKLMFTSIMPRKVSDIICWLNGRKEGYRNYIYTDFGYKRLLKRAGFSLDNVEIIYPVASYKDPFFLFSYNDEIAYRYAFKYLKNDIFPTKRNNIMYTLLYNIGLEKFFAPSYLLLAGNGRKRIHRLIDKYLRELDLGINEYEIIKVLGNLHNNGQLTFLILDALSGKPNYIFKVKRYGNYPNDYLERVSRIRDFNISNLILPIKVKDFFELYNFIESDNSKQSVELLYKAVDLIKGIHKVTQTSKIEIIAGVTSGVGFIHGDYTLDNIIWNEDKPMIIDFERSEFNGVQIFDLCSIIIHYYRFYSGIKFKNFYEIILTEEVISIFNRYSKEIDSIDKVEKLFYLFAEKEFREYENDISSKRLEFFKYLKGHLAHRMDEKD